NRLLNLGFILVKRGRFRLGVLQALPEAAQRGAQVMCDVVGDLLHTIHQDLSSVEHGVHADRQFIYLVACLANDCAFVEISAHYGLRRSSDPVEPPQEAKADEKSATKSKHERRSAR